MAFYDSDEIRQIGVLGSGVMGHGIAWVAAQTGYEVCLHDISADMLQRARHQLETFSQQSVEKGRLTATARTEALNRIRYVTEPAALAHVQLAVEAVPERVELKQRLLCELEAQGHARLVLATNTSSIPVTQIAAALAKPARLVGMHFFNPAPLMKLVEVVAGLDTAPELPATIATVAVRMGKTPAHVADSPGFIVNRVARFFYLESLRLVEDGIATPETIDAIMKMRGFRMGPFELMDLIGVETNHSVTTSIYEQFMHEPRFRPSRLQQQLVDAGHHGRKTRRGFYRYE